VDLDGIAPPSRKAGLVILKGASGGAADREAGAGLMAAVAAAVAVVAAVAVAVEVGVGCALTAPGVVAGCVEEEAAHPATTRVSDASQTVVVRRMAGLSTRGWLTAS
jgi:hypothetical protein